MKEDIYVACQVCKGVEGYVWDDDQPEVCTCGDEDGIDEDGRVIITMRAMKSLRRTKWERLVGWDARDLDRVYTAKESLPEDVQDQASPMVVIGSDVINLYPNLDIGGVLGIVREAVLETIIKWEDIDYLEAARYVELNWRNVIEAS